MLFFNQSMMMVFMRMIMGMTMGMIVRMVMRTMRSRLVVIMNWSWRIV